MTASNPELSVVLPVFNEEENLRDVHQQLVSELGKLNKSFEIVFVDDGSRDKSFEILREINKTDPRVRAVRFSRNFGHHIALTAGMDIARGDAVILMDADLQDPPSEIPKLLAKRDEGFHLVYGIRRQRHDPILKKITSAMFWGILQKFSDVPIPAGQTMLRVLDRKVVDGLKTMRERSRFLAGLMAWVGFETTCVEVEHAPRMKGVSKYNFAKQLKLAFHAVTSFSVVPLRIASYLGIVMAIVSGLVGLFFIAKKAFFGIDAPGFAFIIVSIFFVGSIQMIMLGIFGEYLGRIYQEVQDRPLYVVKETL